MKRFFRDSEHLVRLAVVLAVCVVAFLLIRNAVVPPSFGQYGHYRGASLEEIRQRPITYAGRAACEMCHEPALKILNEGRHKRISCEACHGPQAKHAGDPSAAKPQLPDTTILCGRCHEADKAKPKGFPQVVTKEHSGGVACKDCHKPHQPKL